MSSAIDSIPFLTVEGQPISVGQAFLCLQLFGRLQPFVQDFLRYYTIYRELQTRDDIEVASVELGQTVFDFRIREDLMDPGRFGQWLASRGIDYPMFEQQVLISLKLEKLKNRLAEESLQTLFDGSKQALEQIDLSYVVVDEEPIAEEIKQKIATDTSFDQLTQIYPLNAGPQVLVKREINRRGQLREEIRVAIETVAPKELVGPIPMGDRWCVCRVEQVLPAVLDDATRQELREGLFDRWLAEKQQQLAVVPIADSSSVSSETATEAV